MEGSEQPRVEGTLPPSENLDEDNTAVADLSNEMMDEEGDYCRICRGEATTEQPLFYPCKCSGSIRFVHQDCLMEWLSHSQKKYCELCKTPFRFTKLYDQSMPSTLPLPLFLQQVIFHGMHAILRNTRYVAVTLVWLCWLPWSIRQVWRGLFWVADGSWVSRSQLQDALMSEIAAKGGVINTTISDLGSITDLANPTSPASAPSAVQVQASLFSGFLGLFTGDFLLVELGKLVYPSFFRWTLRLVSADSADDPLLLLTMDRQPSLLSNVGIFDSLTKHRFLNGALVDVLEGQLICLLIVIAFILVFLIREWVINQQPIANMPNPDQPAEVARPGQAAEEAVLRRRRAAIRPVQLGPAPADQNRALVARQIAIPRRRRQHVNDHGLALQAQIEPQGQDLDSASIQAAADPSSPIRQASDTGSTDSSAWVDEDTSGSLESLEARPPLPARGAFDNIANIQRSIEEGSTDHINLGTEMRDFIEHLEAEKNLEGTESNWDSVGPSWNPVPTGQNFHPSYLGDDPTPEISTTQPSGLESHDQSHDSLEMLDLSERYLEAHNGETDANEVALVGDGKSSASNTFTKKDASASGSNNVSTTSANSNQTPETPETMSEPNEEYIENETVEPADPLSLDIIFDWFWHVDGDPPVAEDTITADEEHVVENEAAEAPFVPVHNREAHVHNQPAVNNAPPIMQQEPNMLFGVNLNDADAMEDAEDLDGILELIGMQGPLAGMIQNVIFSEFLITLTIAASVWLPYIWGKIALLILANPVGVFVRAPLHFASKTADFTLDLAIFITGMLMCLVVTGFKSIMSLAAPRFSSLPDIHFDKISWNMTTASGSRLEKALSGTVLSLKPDLPTFSLQSHHALRVFEKKAFHYFSVGGNFIRKAVYQFPARTRTSLLNTLAFMNKGITPGFLQTLLELPKEISDSVLSISNHMYETWLRLSIPSSPELEEIDISLVKWGIQDKILAVVLGYLFFACIGFLYLKVARILFNLKAGERVEGLVADSLRQAGGVLKVVIIIGIEMLVFPLYCGLLLDIALMPLFEGASLYSRAAFLFRAPITGLFVHWFIGTCYMFHFALFVSMCRRILRRGVLYFIRDPDDPTFHPVRDVLERPVATQLGKIAFSAFVYGGLVILCLGGVVWALSFVDGVLPIHWSTNEPRLAFPIDVVFFNFLLPTILRNVQPSNKISAMFEWWFRGCAHSLRLTHFLFGEERQEEKGTHVRRSWSAKLLRLEGDMSAPIIGEDRQIFAEERGADAYFLLNGTYVRAPASDSVRIPKGNRVFLEVNENNERIDGQPDLDTGMHGGKDAHFVHLYIPPNFRSRVVTFLVLLWLFAALTGIGFTIGPLLLGRTFLRLFSHSEQAPNDLYALTIGVHIFGGVAYTIAKVSAGKESFKKHGVNLLNATRGIISHVYPTTKYVIGLIYLGISFGFAFPLAFSLLTELYIHIPLYEYLSTDNAQSQETSESRSFHLPPTVFMLQTWTIGLLLIRVIASEALGSPDSSRPARAIRGIIRSGWSHPDVSLATRAVVLPALLLLSALLLAPLGLGKILNIALGVEDASQRAVIYRYSFPGLMAVMLSSYALVMLKRRVEVWRIKIRDEVYLIGERLHNYQEIRESKGKTKGEVPARVRSERVEVG